MIMDKFKEFPTHKILYVLAVFGFLIVLLVEIFVFIPLESKVSTYGILDYEFAWSATRVLSIFSAWGSTGLNHQIIAIYWDFLFIIGYVSLAFSLITLVFQRSNERIQTIGRYVIITPLLTGIFDVIENVILLIMATNPSSVTDSNALLASLSASIKFALLFIGIIYFILALILIILKKIQKRNE